MLDGTTLGKIIAEAKRLALPPGTLACIEMIETPEGRVVIGGRWITPKDAAK